MITFLSVIACYITFPVNNLCDGTAHMLGSAMRLSSLPE